MRHLSDVQEPTGHSACQGKYKSQRAGPEVVYVKRQVPWPHNYILGGPDKQRVSYDSLNVYQWVAGYVGIVMDEPDHETKTIMLEHLVDLMEDADDFSWSGSKAAHAVILARMEDCRLEWDERAKLDWIRRKNSQRPEPVKGLTFSKHSQNSKFTQQQLDEAPLCKYYNKSSCKHEDHHETNGTIYRHICATCFAFNKIALHSAKHCPELKKKAKNV